MRSEDDKFVSLKAHILFVIKYRDTRGTLALRFPYQSILKLQVQV